MPTTNTKKKRSGKYLNGRRAKRRFGFFSIPPIMRVKCMAAEPRVCGSKANGRKAAQQESSGPNVAKRLKKREHGKGARVLNTPRKRTLKTHDLMMSVTHKGTLWLKSTNCSFLPRVSAKPVAAPKRRPAEGGEGVQRQLSEHRG